MPKRPDVELGNKTNIRKLENVMQKRFPAFESFTYFFLSNPHIKPIKIYAFLFPCRKIQEVRRKKRQILHACCFSLSPAWPFLAHRSRCSRCQTAQSRPSWWWKTWWPQSSWIWPSGLAEPQSASGSHYWERMDKNLCLKEIKPTKPPIKWHKVEGNFNRSLKCMVLSFRNSATCLYFLLLSFLYK